VTIRNLAGAAGVPPALVVRHYQPEDGRRDAVDDHLGRNLEAVFTEMVPGPAAAQSGPATLTGPGRRGDAPSSGRLSCAGGSSRGRGWRR